jgi:hypothetical protein
MATIDGNDYWGPGQAVLSFPAADDGAQSDARRVFWARVATKRNGKDIEPELVVHDCGCLDAPMWQTVIAGQSVGNLARAKKELDGLLQMSWDEFKKFCRISEGYTGKIDDIEQDLEAPRPTSTWNALILGGLDLSNEPDIRPYPLRFQHDDTNLPYEFPAIGRLGIIRELAGHYRMSTEDGTRLAWRHDRPIVRESSGSMGCHKVSTEHDAAWADYYADNKEEIRARINDMILADIQERHGLMGADCEFGFEPGLRSNETTLAMLDGIDLTFENSHDMCEALNAMSDHELTHLWKMVRCLDYDFGEMRLEDAWAMKMNEVRAEFEASLEMQSAPPMF